MEANTVLRADEQAGRVRRFAAVADPAFGPTADARLAALAPALAGPAVPPRVCGRVGRGEGGLGGPRRGVRRHRDGGRVQAVPRTAGGSRPATGRLAGRPGRAAAGIELVSVCVGMGRPRDEMEGWFRRAVAADPDHYSVYRSKLTFLLPQWHGSADELLAFGRQCAAAGRPDNRLADVLYDAHIQVNRGRQKQYWRDPPVRAELTAAFEPGLRAAPTDRQFRTRMALLADLWGDPEATDAHLKAINDRVWPGEFRNPSVASAFRADVDAALERLRESRAADKP